MASEQLIYESEAPALLAGHLLHLVVAEVG